MLPYIRISVKFRDKEIRPLMFGPLADNDDGDAELLKVSSITERMLVLVNRINRSSGLIMSERSYDRFNLYVDLRENPDPKLPAMLVRQLMVEQYLTLVEDDLFKCETALPPIDFDDPPTRWEKIRNWFRQLPDRLSDYPSSYTYTGEQMK